MLNNVAIKRHNDGGWFKVIVTMTTLKMLMLLITLPFVLRAPASAATVAESEINANTLKAKGTSKLANHVAASVKPTKPELRQFPFNVFMMPLPLPMPPLSPLQPALLPGCPLCDSSVYSYCSYKLIHDSCCCDFSGAVIYQKPPQCTFYDCTLLYAKSCYEYTLLQNCCCNNPY